MGRPRIEIDKCSFEKLCGIQCTLVEISQFFKCCEDTIESWCKREYRAGFSEVYKKFSAAGKISLRRAQFRLAETNASMAMFLGKQYLGQRDVEPKEQDNKQFKVDINIVDCSGANSDE